MKPFFFTRLMRTALALLSCGVILSGCALDFVNPNAAPEPQVVSTREGLLGLAVGMQQFYATSALEAYITRSGVTTRELGVTTTFQNPLDLEVGGTGFPSENGDILAIWSRSYRVIGMADNIITNAPTVTMPPGTRSGLIALASLYKAMCLSHLVMYFEQAPISTGTASNPATFRSRADVLAEAVRLLENAAQQLSANAVSTEFTSSALARGMNLPNTIQAIRARCLIMAGRNADAIQAANAVSTSASASVFAFDAQLNRNPIFLSITQGGSSYGPRVNFGLPASLVDTNDARIRYFLTTAVRLATQSRLPVNNLTATSFFGAVDVSIPVFRLGEMALIRAEAQARQNNLTAAVAEINTIRTKRATSDPHGIGAGLPPYSGTMTQDAILTEIYAQRSAELFLTGMRMEDARRFGRSAPSSDFSSERSRNYYPYPALERDNNRNVPNNPPN